MKVRGSGEEPSHWARGRGVDKRLAGSLAYDDDAAMYIGIAEQLGGLGER